MNNNCQNESQIGDLDIAVVGMNCRFPDANNIESYWENLKKGVESVYAISDEELLQSGVSMETVNQPNYVKAGSFIEDYDKFAAGFFGYSAKEAALMDPQQRVFLELCWHAMENAGYDAEKFAGIIGLFAGASYNSYLLNNVLKGRSIVNNSDNFFVQILNDKDNLAMRTAYKLNLNGPAITIQTACSTSLVAVHLACQSLLNRECDVALAGGVTIRSPHKAGYFYQEELIFSKDGHCRPFDAKASGTIFGSGAGVVILKRLEDAVADGDNIQAIVKASAVNNDGAEKVGYTAPGRKGQEAVLASALALANIPKETITAIEAHGTGTLLGDPIEFESLNKVYGSQHVNHKIALGSVKSNLGHLENAAGIASFIKMVLCLKNKTLVPSLNFKNHNPHINMENTPFYVNTGVKEWNLTGNTPRRCAVSAFGMGGTNAHVILEEGCVVSKEAKARPAELVLLSARTETALNKMSDNLAEYIKKTPDSNLSAIAHTLRIGRREFAFRRAAVASDAASFTKIVEENDINHTWSSHKKVNDPQVVLMFPGQGAQYIRMAKEIYDYEPIFKQVMDDGTNILKQYLNLDVRDVLFPAEENANKATHLLTQTKITQPVLFLVEYALAKLLMHWGIKPGCMIGHSIGEYVAACLAQVICFEDALKVVAKRGELINDLPLGRMCAVMLAEEQVKPLLNTKLSIAAINGPSVTVVAGPEKDIRKFTAVLTEKGLSYRLLHTSHAFHSWMMQAAYEPFLDFLKQVKLNIPRVPYISNVTGDWISEEQATSEEYWARQIVAPVRFNDGLSTLLKNDKNVYVEVGPGTTLGAFVKKRDINCPVVSCLPHAQENQNSLERLYISVAKLWITGVSFKWENFDKNSKWNKVELPGYPFEKQSYWVQPSTAGYEESFESMQLNISSAAAVEYTSAAPAVHGPQNELEQRIMELVASTLGMNRVDIRDNFFDLGGNSLLAIQLLTKLNAQFDTQIKVNEFFNFPSVQALAQEISNRKFSLLENKTGTNTFPELIEDLDKRYDLFSLTEMQEAQWLGRISSFRGGNVAAHVYFESEKAGIDLERLQKSWQFMIDRHEMLRTVLMSEGLQYIVKGKLNYTIQNLDLRHHDADSVAKELSRVRGEMDHLVRPLDKWPLFEVRTTQLPGNKVRIHFSIDLLICDFASLRILQGEWARAYKNPEYNWPALNVSFRDYVIAEKKLKNTEPYVKANAYWEKKVTELPLTTAPGLPIAKDLSTIKEPRFQRWSFVIDREKWELIKKAAIKRTVSPSTVILTAFAQILRLWSGTPEFCINMPIINRLPLHPQIEDVIGEFSSFAPITVNLKADKSFEKLAQELQQTSWENLENRYVSGTSILRKLAKYRGGSTGAVLPVVFTSTIVQKVEGEQDFEEQFGGYYHLMSQTPQVWLDHTAMENSRGLLLSWHALAEMFPMGLLDRMWDAYEQFMNRLGDDENTWNTHYYDLFPPTNIAMLQQVNDTKKEFDYELLHAPIFHQAVSHPDKPAIISERKEVSYKALVAWANGLGRELNTQGLKKAELAAIIMEKGYEQIVSVLGILQGGGAYLPLEPDLPSERLNFIIENSKVRFVLTQSKYKEKLQWLESKGISIIVISEQNLLNWQSPEFLPAIQEPDDLAYVIFTSGSTGNPKGVMMTHRMAQNTILDVNEKFQVTDAACGFAISELNFDLSVYDIFGILGAGGTLVMPNAHTSRNTDHWLDLITRYQVNTWNSVPALMTMLVEYAGNKIESLPLELIMMSGDWIPLGLPSLIQKLCPKAKVISLGGATEGAIWSIYYPINCSEAYARSIPYGKPLANQQMYILNQEIQPCPVWVQGEIYIGGTGVALGYLNEPALTANAFITNPHTGAKLYKTGDMGRYLPDGNIEFLGREDFQVKISGFRVELEEIEAALLNHPLVKAAIVNAVGELRDKKRLIGYIVPKAGTKIEIEAIKETAAGLLPEYMIPSEYVFLDSLPLTFNGKIDRKSLPLPKQSQSTGKGDLSKESLLLFKKLTPIFADVLKLDEDQVDIYTNFFALGGDSISGIQIISRAEKEGIEISPQQFFEYPTIAQLVQTLSINYNDYNDGAEALVGSLPLSNFQQWMLTNYDMAVAEMNWSAIVKVVTPFQPNRLEVAFQNLIETHDIFHVHFLKQSNQWEQEYQIDKVRPEMDYVDISGSSEEEVRKIFTEIQAQLVSQQELSISPLLKLCLFNNEQAQEQYVMVVWNQMIMDLHACELFLKELELEYVQLDDKNKPKRKLVRKQFKNWLEDIDRMVRSASEAATSLSELSKNVSKPVPVVNFGKPTKDEFHLEDIKFTIPKNDRWSSALETAKLKGEELFLTALALSLQKLNCAKALYADCVLDSSLDSLKQVGYENVIGQFKRVFPILLNFNLSNIAGLDEIIRNSKTLIRQYKEKMPPYNAAQVANSFPINFTYSERTGNISENYIWQKTNNIKEPAANPNYIMAIEVVSEPAKIALAITFDAAKAQKEIVAELGQVWQQEVQNLINYIQNEDKNFLVSTDFPDLSWDENEFNDFIESLQYAENI